MVIRGNTRGNGMQLGRYLLSLNENESIQILDVAGRNNARDDYLHQVIEGMQLNSELTNSIKGLYHAQINPAAGEARNMAPEDWFKAADILGKELGLEDQRRIIVLHEKKGRTHAHVVWERFDHNTGKIKSDSFSRLAQDRARMKMEEVFGHERTPRRNQHRPEMKAALTALWDNSKSGTEFMNKARQAGYMVAQGSMRNPYMIVDGNGRSFDLVRQLKQVRLKDVRSRMRGENLMPEKQAIEYMRSQQAKGSGKTDRETGSQQQKTIPKTHSQEFAQNGNDISGKTAKQQESRTSNATKQATGFQEERDNITKSKHVQSKIEPDIAQDFARTRQEITNEQELADPEADTIRKQFMEELDDMEANRRKRKRGRRL